MKDTGVAVDSREQTDDRFKTLNYHIRSASTLGQMLSQTEDFHISPGEPMQEGRTNVLVSLLSSLAQCLNRTNVETVAVGLIENRIEAANGDATNGDAANRDLGSDSQKTIAQQLWENARYAKNSINANIPKNQQHEILPINIKGWESLRKGNRERVNIMEVIYQHCSFVRDKGCSISSRKEPDRLHNLYPGFPDHAQMVFQLLQTYLKLEASSPNDLDACFRARMDFKCYVIGMSLAKLHAQVEERDWAVKKYEKGFRQFLESEVDEHQFHVSKTDLKWTPILKKRFLEHANAIEGLHLDFIALAQKVEVSGSFDIDLARVIHQILRFNFDQIVQSLNELQQLRLSKFDQGNKFSQQQTHKLENFTKKFEKLVTCLLALQAFVADCKKLFSFYREVINAPNRKSHPSSSTMRCEGDKSEDNKVWLDSYINWIKKIVRQSMAAARLTSLSKHPYERHLMELQIESIEVEQPSATMEDWKRTISQIYSQETTYHIAGTDSNEKISQQVQDCLKDLANNAPYKENSCYNWLIEWKFTGAIHCEAMIACKNIVRPTKNSRMRNMGIGVSKRCCVVCSYILQEAARLGVDLYKDSSIAKLFVNYLGNSNKIFSCALPEECPLEVAEKVSKRLDELLQEKLTESLPSLQEKVNSVPISCGSSGSLDSEVSDQHSSDWKRLLKERYATDKKAVTNMDRRLAEVRPLSCVLDNYHQPS